MSHYNNNTRVMEDCRGSVRKVAGNNIYLFNRRLWLLKCQFHSCMCTPLEPKQGENPQDDCNWVICVKHQWQTNVPFHFSSFDH